MRALVAQDPGLFERLGLDGRIETLHKAVTADRPEAARLMAELGFELSDMTPGKAGLDRTALHEAAWAGNLEMVKLLLELGADLTVRDASHGATPLGWAEHNHRAAVFELLRTR